METATAPGFAVPTAPLKPHAVSPVSSNPNKIEEEYPPPTVPDALDKGTPDEWVARNPKMLRHTGRHTYNAEAPMADLMRCGFITPTALFVVRNHGLCPKVDWDTHTLEINGLVEHPYSLTMRELSSLPSITIPITLTCSGNRRAELRAVRTSMGFDWEHCATGTSLFTGVRLRDLLLRAGVKSPEEPGAPSHVLVRGVSKEVPEGRDTSYGTSLSLARALDPASDVMVAWLQNGRPLRPDHGYPIRLMVPGCIGGRMVKWLKEITLSDRDSDNHYHFHDNRVVPGPIDELTAEAKGWWHKEDYMVYELNVNSVITQPLHDTAILIPHTHTPTHPPITPEQEELDESLPATRCVTPTRAQARERHPSLSLTEGPTLPSSPAGHSPTHGGHGGGMLLHREAEQMPAETVQDAVTVKGYALSGGGRKVIRCEVSVDGGHSWRLAEIHRYEQPNAFGKHWCWVFFETEIKVSELMRVSSDRREIVCRAVDESMNSQPSEPTECWNAKGMLNNCCHRVKYTLEDTHNTHGGRYGRRIRFQHPTAPQPGPLGHKGWRQELRGDTGNLKAPRVVAVLAGRKEESPGGVARVPTGEGVAQPLVATPVSASAAKQHKQLFAAATKDLAEQEAAAGGVLAGSEARLVWQPPYPARRRYYSINEVAKHASKESSWLAMGGGVYDATPFLSMHPGGPDSVVAAAGTDATDLFRSIHGLRARDILNSYFVGLLADRDTVLPTPEAPLALDPRWRVALPLMEKRVLNHNTRIYSFKLPSERHWVGMPVGTHITVLARIDGEAVVRPYTPITGNETPGRVDLLIKVYWRGEHPRFPEGGKMSQHIEALQLGDTLEFAGTMGHFQYLGRGRYILSGGQEIKKCNRMSMVAGGTGITPCYQLIQAVLRDPEDATKISLIFANRSETDMLLRDELQALAEKHPEQFTLWNSLDTLQHPMPFQGKGHVQYSVGHVTEQLMRQQLFGTGESSIAFVCGPPGLVVNVALPSLLAMGYTQEQIVEF